MPHKQKELKKSSKPKKKDEPKAADKPLTTEDLQLGEVLEITYTPQDEKPQQFSATVKNIFRKKKKPFLLECSDGKVGQPQQFLDPIGKFFLLPSV